MPGHPAEGVLRRYLDEPVAVSLADRTHLTSCARCGAALTDLDADREVAAGALALLDPPVADAGLDRAWEGLADHLAGTGPAPVAAAGSLPRRLPRRALRRHPVAAAVAAGLVLVGGTAAAAAADWLPVFHAKKVAPVSLSATDLSALGDVERMAELSGYGTVTMPSGNPVTPVADAATAAARSGLTVPAVGTLPRGVEGAPTYAVVGRQVAEFTFSAGKAAATVKAHGGTLPPVPAGVDGSRLRLEAGPGVLVTWGRHGQTLPSLLVARIAAPTLRGQGAPVPVLRDYLLSLPGIPAGVAAQLRQVTTDGSTLPLPVPEQLATATSADVGGVRATVLQTKDGVAAGVVWVENGVLQAVAGPLTRDDVLEVARGLH